MHTSNRESRHGRGGGRGGGRWDDRRTHNNGGYNGGHQQRDNYDVGRGGHPGNQHQGDYGSNRHPRDGSFVIDRGGVRENDDRMSQYGNGRGRGRDSSRGEEGEANDAKRPASSSPDRRSDAVPEEVRSAVVEFESANDDVTEEEHANRKAFEDCLRDMDKALPVWKLAHQLPMDRRNEKENSKVETWNERETYAMEATITSISEDLMSGRITRPWQSQQECDSDSDESYPPRASHHKASPKDLSPMEKRFIEALPRCLPLNRGFHVTQFAASEICYCPCGPNVEPWRNQNKIFFDACKQKKRFHPNDLMDHLRKEGGVYEEKEQGKKVKRNLKCLYHYAAAEYLRILYADWHGPNFSHKALHPRLTMKYRKADDEDSRRILRALEFESREKRKTEKEVEKLRAEMEKKDNDAAFFRDLAKHHQARALELEKTRERFQVENRRKKDKLTDSQFAKYEKMMTDYFDTMKQLVGIYKKRVPIEVTSKTSDEGGFYLQDFFNNLYEKKEEAGASAHAVLFGDKNTKLILSQWEIVYDKKTELLAPRDKEEERAQKKLAKKLTGKDEGGPSRQFLTDIFKQIDKLYIPVGTESVMLFENTPSGVMVTTDEQLEHHIEIAAKKCHETEDKEKIVKKAKKRAKTYTRAIGRIMLHALANKQTLPTNAMPPFLINLMFRGYDSDYEPDDILNHIGMLAFPGEKELDRLLDCGETDEDGEPWTRETFFTKFIPDNVINTRKILLGSLRDGLTCGDPSNELEKGCDLAIRWSMVPLQAIQHTYFARPEISVEDLINILVPKFGVGKPEKDYGKMEEADKERIKELQRKFYNTGFKTFLTESAEENPSFLMKFVECVTGSNYLPYDKTFKIYIEFNFSLPPQGYPLFHSCTHEIVLPGYEVYFSDYQKFKHDMTMIIEEIYNRFDME